MKKDGLLYSTLPLLFCLLVQAEPLPAIDKAAPGGPVTIKADTLTYDQANDTYQADGNVIIYFSGGFLQADRVLLNRRTNDAVAEGNTYLRSDGDVLQGERVDFNTETKTGAVQSGKIFFERFHFYIRGKEIQKKGEADYFMKDGTATTCDGDCPDWRFAAREMDVTIDGYGTMKDGTFQIREVPMLYFPYLIFPVKTTRQSGVLFPYLGYSDDKVGFDVEVPVFWAISENTDATFYQRYMDKRGYMQGAEFRYFPAPGTFGTFYADYLDDKWTGRNDIHEMERNWTDRHNRWSYYLNHQSSFGPDLYLRTDINKVSDPFYFSDFSSHNYYLDHYAGRANRPFERISYVGDKRLDSLDSKGRLVKNWGLVNATGIVRYTDDFTETSNDKTLQKYPEVSLTAFTQPVFGSPLNFGMNGSYSYNYRSVGEKGNLFDIAPVLSLPMNLGSYLQFTPEIGLVETYWDTSGALTGSEKKAGSRQIALANAKLSSYLYKIFDVGGESVDKIKHYVKPELIYTYATVSADELPDFVTTINTQNSITWSLLNTLTSRFRDQEGKWTYREFLRLKLFQLFDFRGEVYNINPLSTSLTPVTTSPVGGPGHHFGPLNAELEFYPYRYMSYKSTLVFDVNSSDWTAMTHELGVYDERGDSARVQYLYTQNSVEQVNLLLQARVTRAVDLGYRLRQNLFEGDNLESTYYVAFRRQCWGIEFAYSDERDDRNVQVRLNLLGLSQPPKKTPEEQAKSGHFWFQH
ncbi:MAG TPA: LPS assembly protein LptD [Syntrophales bacterium]|nr:LPS assembly protein LptD [Syntrophales bacterium]HOX95106.1 LPS assembly protein LptD [Syntrophales bacterium]HPI57308.1 LPS assembly protein LptD [Syntrophales bacterium]HPN25188.1 LPS assembly protein LptD [Syntrophales bacterium]HQM29393.1 LPS assembly protein LptD [Syntrophales bacterium]